MEGAIHGLQGIFEVLFIIGIGFVLAKKNWFDTASSALLTRFIMKISLPLNFFFIIVFIASAIGDSASIKSFEIIGNKVIAAAASIASLADPDTEYPAFSVPAAFFL